MLKKILKFTLAIIFIICFGIFANYFRYRFIPLVAVENHEEISFKDI
jgi:hypothetical protein